MKRYLSKYFRDYAEPDAPRVEFNYDQLSFNRRCPCDACEQKYDCSSSGKECQAFRHYVNFGEWDNSLKRNK